MIPLPLSGIASGPMSDDLKPTRLERVAESIPSRVEIVAERLTAADVSREMQDERLEQPGALSVGR